MRTSSTSNAHPQGQELLLEAQTGLRLLEEPLLNDDAYDDNEPSAGECDNVAESSSSSSCCFSFWDRLCLFVILPTLLGLQFAIALPYSTHSSSKRNAGLEVAIAIGLFVLISYMYKQCLQDDSCLRLVARLPATLQAFGHLVPEILVDLVLGVVLAVSVDAGLTALLASTLLLSLAVVAVSLHQLLQGASRTTAANDDDELMEEHSGECTELYNTDKLANV